ncbi:hypothetical protein HHK36_028569 [Tetracentron sinense]|uniref:Uncharacterized protein n=1 Tax=Tetracentron sinense TaxID=13715 RepID=A0A834YHL1_TETSI|nr:hypothetical protein HHK36_028569 [Tetracentron sinense]
MRCKKHFSDLSSVVGVCASCLRERLFALISAQARQQALARADEDRRKSDAHPPPLVFPRSVSPYICRRSDDSSWHHHIPSHQDRRFYSTPQVGPTSTTTTSGISGKKKHSKFSLFSNLFSSRSDEPDSDPRVSRPSWFSSLLSGGRKKQSRLFSLDEPCTAPPGRRPCRTTRDRGMSPAKDPHEDEDDEKHESSPMESGYSSESSQGWKKTPTHPQVRRGGQSRHSRNVSGLAFCLSPLVRASPNRHRNQKGAPPDVGFSGEIRVSKKPHLSTAASFCANRSRKLADFGRYNFNP